MKITIVGISLLLMVGLVQAEIMRSLAQGTSVRLKIVPVSDSSIYSWIAGDIKKLSGDTLAISHEDGSISAFPLNSITRFERERHSLQSRGALKGAGIGFILGGIAGTLTLRNTCDDPGANSDIFEDFECSSISGASFLAGAAIGSIMGSVVGSLFDPWEPVSLPFRVTLKAHNTRDVAVILNLSKK